MAETATTTMATTGLVHFKHIHRQVFGDHYFSGEVAYKDPNTGEKKVAKYKGSRRLITNGFGFVLNLANPNHRELLAMYESPTLNHLWSKNKAGRRFEKIDMEGSAVDYLKSDEVITNLKSIIYGLKGKELKAIGLFFKVSGSEATIKSGLIKLAAEAGSRDKVSTLLLHPDRKLMEYIQIALEEGNAAKKEGLYKNANGLFLFNNIPLGVDVNSVLAFLKGDSEQQEAVYKFIKEIHDRSEEKK